MHLDFCQHIKMTYMDMTEYYEELAKNMRIERARLNISQLRLSVLVNVSLDTINLIERAAGNPKLSTIISIAKALKVDLNTLIKL